MKTMDKTIQNVFDKAFNTIQDWNVEERSKFGLKVKFIVEWEEDFHWFKKELSRETISKPDGESR